MMDKAQELIVIKQLPVITERLKMVSEDVKTRISAVLAMDCTEETRAALKKERTSLKKEFEEFEERRAAVKSAIITPYEKFNDVYKALISDHFKDADEKIKAKIDEVEDGIKSRTAEEVLAYFEECKQAANIDFITFEQVGLNITLSVTPKKLKEQVSDFISRIEDDLRLIEAQQYRDEIMVEYRKTLNCSAAVTAVVERHKALEAEAERKAEAEARRAAEAAAVAKVVEAAPIDVPMAVPVEKPAVQENVAPVVLGEKDPILSATFTVTASKSKLLALKEFLNDGGYTYE